MQTTRNIIILNNLGSENIEQAIIILKNKSKLCAPQEDIVFEAQKVIDDFIAKNKRQARRIREVRSILVLLPVIGFLGLVMFFLFRFL